MVMEQRLWLMMKAVVEERGPHVRKRPALSGRHGHVAVVSTWLRSGGNVQIKCKVPRYCSSIAKNFCFCSAAELNQ